MRHSKKGSVSLGDTPNIALTLILVAAVFVGGFLVLEGLRDGINYSQDQYYSASAANGCNSTDTNQCQMYLATSNLTEGMSNITGYMPTIGVIVGVAVLLGVVLAGFGFARNQGYL